MSEALIADTIQVFSALLLVEICAMSWDGGSVKVLRETNGTLRGFAEKVE